VQISANVLRAIYNQWAFKINAHLPSDGCILDVVAPTSIDVLLALIRVLDTSVKQEIILFTRTQDADIREWLSAIQRAILKKCFKRNILGSNATFD
jgi:hypothetical protein